jgi:FKBP-type peptidyl-prolyl cis-trans isomerase
MKKKMAGFIALLTLAACTQTPEPKKEAPVWTREQSTAMNKEMTLEEDLDIRMYLEQHSGLEAESTGSGLRYIRIRPGTGEQAATGREAKVQYKVSLLDGTTCYETAADEVEVFRIDKSTIETGIQEGIKKMRVGEKARLIIPSHLAHGLIGDLDKIPPVTPIVVDIELIELK